MIVYMCVRERERKKERKREREGEKKGEKESLSSCSRQQCSFEEDRGALLHTYMHT